jgi:hypothetical protein
MQLAGHVGCLAGTGLRVASLARLLGILTDVATAITQSLRSASSPQLLS